MNSTPATTTPAPFEPWFARYPGLALAGVASMFVAITVLRFALGDDASVGVTLFFVVPISLAALAWGRLPGLVAAGTALTALTLWVLLADVDLTPLGWAARVVPILLAGLLLGDTSDRLRRAEQARIMQAGRELRHRQAVEINDSLLQEMAAAKWALEAGNHDLGLKGLDTALSTGQRLVSELIREARMGPLDAQRD